MIRITFGHSASGRVEEIILPDALSVQLTYALLRDDDDNAIAEFDRGLWKRSDTGTFWTDVSIDGGHA